MTVNTEHAEPAFSPLIQGYWRMLDWNRSPQEHLCFLQRHLELGISTVDHADLYGNYGVEAAFGEVLALKPGLRHKLQIVTKCGIQLLSDKAPQRTVKHYDTSSAHIERSVHASLKALQTDYLDTLLLHRPDPLMNADEICECVVRLRDAGKVRHFGVSNFAPASLELLSSRLPFALVTNQVEINPLNQQVLFDGTLDQLQRLQIRPMAWSCLAGGRLFNPHDEQGQRTLAVLSSVGESLGGYAAEQVALAWVLKLPSQPFPILGSGRTERMESALAALDIELSREQWFAILQAGAGHEIP